MYPSHVMRNENNNNNNNNIFICKLYALFFLIPMRQLLFLHPFYRWENWGIGMLSDLPKEYAVKESGFESSFVWIHQNPVSYFLSYNTKL